MRGEGGVAQPLSAAATPFQISARPLESEDQQSARVSNYEAVRLNRTSSSR